MSIMENYSNAMKNKDETAMNEILHDDFKFIMHKSRFMHYEFKIIMQNFIHSSFIFIFHSITIVFHY